MITTEDEARKKWCPHSRRLIELRSTFGNPVQGFSANRTTEDKGLGACLGSACMAWRWETYHLDPQDRRRLGGNEGFCGLAGRP